LKCVFVGGETMTALTSGYTPNKCKKVRLQGNHSKTKVK